MAYGHLTGNMLAEVEGFPDAMRLIDLIVDTIRFENSPTRIQLDCFLHHPLQFRLHMYTNRCFLFTIVETASMANKQMKACSFK